MTTYKYEKERGLFWVTRHYKSEDYDKLFQEAVDSREISGRPSDHKPFPTSGGPIVALMYEEKDAIEYCLFKNEQLQ